MIGLSRKDQISFQRELDWFISRSDGADRATIYMILHAKWLKLKQFNPNQPRDEIGRWTETGAGDQTGTDLGGLLQLAGSFPMGILLADYATGNGRICVYDFGHFRIVVPGPTHRCQDRVFLPNTTHGYLLNDN